MKVGDLIDRRYRLVGLMCMGGAGIVYEVNDEVSGQRLALKCLVPTMSLDEDMATRFILQARSAGAIESQHVVRVTDGAISPDGAPYIVMEYLEGENLELLLMREERLTRLRAVTLTLQVCEALELVHKRGIIHRALTPEKLFIVRRNERYEWAKVIDFGIAELQTSITDPSVELIGSGTMMGAPCYMAPEQLESTYDVDPRTDVYSVGVILYELLTGRRPYNATTCEEMIAELAHKEHPLLRSFDPSFDPELEQIVECSIAREPDSRFSSIAEFADALHAYIDILLLESDEGDTLVDRRSAPTSSRDKAVERRSSSTPMTDEIPTDVTKPPPTTDEIPTVVRKPPTKSSVPPTVVAQLPATASEPPTVVVQPLATASEPPTDVVQPPKTDALPPTSAALFPTADALTPASAVQDPLDDEITLRAQKPAPKTSLRLALVVIGAVIAVLFVTVAVGVTLTIVFPSGDPKVTLSEAPLVQSPQLQAGTPAEVSGDPLLPEQNEIQQDIPQAPASEAMANGIAPESNEDATSAGVAPSRPIAPQPNVPVARVEPRSQPERVAPPPQKSTEPQVPDVQSTQPQQKAEDVIPESMDNIPPPQATSLKGFLSVSTQPPTKVYVDGVYVQVTPVTRYETDVGRHLLTMISEDTSIRETESVHIEADETRSIVRDFRAPAKTIATTGTLTVVSQPPTKVYINGRFIQSTPLRNHELPVGTHRLSLINLEDDIRHASSFAIKAGEDTRISRDFPSNESSPDEEPP